MAFANETIGIHVVTSTLVRIYVNDEYKSSHAHPAQAGTKLAMAALYTVGSRVGRFEAWTEPGGTLVTSDEFSSLAAWSLGNEGALWSASGGDATVAAPIVGSNPTLLRNMPVGANYFVLRDVDMDDTDTADRWVMIVPFKSTATDYTVGGLDGYRLLIRQFLRSGGPPATVLNATYQMEVVNASTSFDEGLGWQVGSVAI